MIKSVIIEAMHDAAHYPFKENLQQDLWVTVIDPEDEYKVKKMHDRFSRAGVKHFAQYFRDWSDEDPENFIQQRINLEGPQESHVNNIISFLEPYVYDSAPHHLGVNCLAGVSRSTAIGIIAWVMEGKSVNEALDEILKVRNCAWPNLRILRLASARLNKNIVTPVTEWKLQQKGKLIY